LSWARVRVRVRDKIRTLFNFISSGVARRNIPERRVLHFCLQVLIAVISTSASESALIGIITAVCEEKN